MTQFAVFVDAGYLFAQGSVCISGAKRQRPDLLLNNETVIALLRKIGAQRAPDARLLRIYWYDAPPRGTPSLEQTQIAELEDTKLRLGFLNSAGEQKGVDSLIVTDLIELARQKSICDAVLLSGDEDVRVGVQVAQAYGVRVHLLGIEPARGSQSQQLRFEADTVTEWGRDVVSSFLTLRAQPEVHTATAAPTDFSAAITAVVEAMADDERFALRRFCEANRGLPPEQDSALLKAFSTSIGGRSLEEDQKRSLRQGFRRHVMTSDDFSPKP